MPSKRVQISSYDPSWPALYAAEAELIEGAVGNNLIEIHHIGSTAVPGLVAKPKIDIVAVCKDPAQAIEALADVGYQYKGAWNIPMKWGFAKRGELNVNLHVFEPDNPEIELNLKFRDYLRAHDDARDEYAALKEELLKEEMSHQKNALMFTGYNLGKDAFIKKVLTAAGFDRLRMTFCVHYLEWEAAKNLRNKYFFDPLGIKDPYTWTFEHKDHQHLVLYHGVEVVGYAHIQLWPDNRSAVRIIVLEESLRGEGLGSQFLGFIEKWLKAKGYKSIHAEASSKALSFYKKNHYVDMLFNDPDGYESDPKDTPVGKVL